MSDAAATPPEESGRQETVPGKWQPLRVWPVVVVLVGMLITRLAPQISQDANPWVWMVAAFGPLLGCLAILIWWLTASRATWQERVLGAVLVILEAIMVGLLVDATMGIPGIMVVTLPAGFSAFAIGAILFSRVLLFRRTTIALVLALLGFSFSLLLRNEGMWGDYAMGLKWRWSSSSEDRLVAAKAKPLADIDAPQIEQSLMTAQWPAFRGPNRSGVQSSSMVSTDWQANPPELLWKVPVGPGWSSFVVAGQLLFTQEQRGPNEIVACYDADSGQQVWQHALESRFDDPLGGPGPRATPALKDGGLFALGANGHLLRLDPATGDVVWEQNIAEVAHRKPPMWGFSSSPLVANGKVIVHAGGTDESGNEVDKDKGILAFDANNGELSWAVPSGDHSYSSPELVALLGRDVVLCLTNQGLDFVDPANGKLLLNYEWKVGGYRALQPQVVGDDSIVIPSTMGDGTRRIRVTSNDDQWTAEEVWTSRGIKPDFNDLVIHNGNAYGFDGGIFASIDLENGERNWKKGRYGKGQVLLLEKPGLLLVLSEEGNAVLLEANPESFEELAEFPVLEGKTWNHPVVVGDRLYVRNSQEAACYRLKLEDDSAADQPDASP
ncbi:PQQ-binding-like beta-propeller repeat protein [Blastopirellula marina]|uniref:Alcohol dehydrogenase n=1 Tax=Blastopirellula marina TaxID=124 RepID=A0A2S8GTV8_9BACT|nr:PQQ-binding-like beta-propeller repeat protein [Blastopirellula marina]PQO47865.1 alcohol dehydrogenase [Blastopirellula marina]